MPKYDFPKSVSATSLSNYKACDKQSEYYTFMGLVPKGKSVDLHGGAAFASSIEATRVAFYVGGLDAETAIGRGLKVLWDEYGDFDCPPDSAKSVINLSHAHIAYFDNWPLGEDKVVPLLLGDKHAIEFNGAAAMNIKHPSTGDPILYTFRSDMIGQYNSSLWNVDEKTTGGIGPKWITQWPMRGQFLGTSWACREYGHTLAGTIVRGIAILKYETKFAELPVPFGEMMVNRWYEATLATIRKMIRAWEADEFPYNFGDSCTAFRGCGYVPLCKAQDYTKWLMYYTNRYAEKKA